MAELSIPPRREIPMENTWNAPSVFSSVTAWEEEFKAVEDALPKLQDDKEKTTARMRNEIFFMVRILN